MSRNQRWREEFLVAASKAGLPLDVSRKVLRHAATLQRLAEAQCNGDWPADNGTAERKVIACDGTEATPCGAFWVPSVFRIYGPRQTKHHSSRVSLCPDCRAALRVSALVAPYGLKAYFAGDPRGAVVSLVRADVLREDFESGRVRGIAVPA